MPGTRRRSERIAIRVSPETRQMIDRAVASSGGSLTRFTEESLTASAQRALADRSHFVLSDDQRRAWDELNDRPARDLPGLREFMDRPSPFS